MGEFMTELWGFMKERRKFWLLPIIMALLMLGTLIVLTHGSAVAPFIYTLFLVQRRPVREGELSRTRGQVTGRTEVFIRQIHGERLPV
jgi:hypothetical protein